MKTKRTMKLGMLFLVATCLTMTACAHTSKTKPIPVTAENFTQAETAWNMRNWDKLRNGPGLFHYREPTPTGPEAPTVRMNWDTLYSNRVVTVSDDHEFSVTLPERVHFSPRSPSTMSMAT